ncbi:MAG TPA: autotransporter domain-containing protein [Allosphingosinicella sp.]|jgi:outer membrane autotransporter protein
MKAAIRSVLFATAAVGATAWSGSAQAACSTVTPPDGPTTLACPTNTTTTASTNSNQNNPSTSARSQNFGNSIVGIVNPGVTIDGWGLHVTATGTQSVTFTNNGNVTSTVAAVDDLDILLERALEVRSNGGDVTYNGNGSVSTTNDATALALFTRNLGNIFVGSSATPVTGSFTGRSAVSLTQAVVPNGTDPAAPLRNLNAFFHGGSFTVRPEDNVGVGIAISAQDSNVNLTMTGNSVISTANGVPGGGILVNADTVNALQSGTVNVSTDARIGSIAAPMQTGIVVFRYFEGLGATDVRLTGTGSMVVTQWGILVDGSEAGSPLSISTAAGSSITVVPTASIANSSGIEANAFLGGNIALDIAGSISGGVHGINARPENGRIDLVIQQGATVSGTQFGFLENRFGGSGPTEILVLGTLSSPQTAADFSGTLRVGNGGTAGTIAGNAVNRGTLIFNRSDPVAYGGVVSGSGSLRKAGAGTLTLTGANTYTGGTTIEAGTLQVGDGGTTGSITGNVVDNATLVFNRSDSVTYSGVVSGTGSLRKAGSGTLILTGANTYAGGTAIDSGTLQIGNGGTSGSITGNVVDNATLAFNRSDAVTFGGIVSGTGTVRKQGTGTLTLSGASTYSGSTIVEQGTLLVTGSTVSATQVNTGATLAGTGRVGGAVVAGTAAPGSGGIGTFSTTGNATFSSGSTFQVEVDPAGTSDRITVGGTATLQGGTVQSIFLGSEDNRCGAPIQSAILTAAGGVTGTFSAVTSNFAFLTPSLSYDPNNVFLTLTRNAATFAERGETDNQRQSAAAAEALKCGNALFNPLVQLSAASARAAFDQISGEIHAGARGALFDDSRFVRDSLLSSRRKGRGLWASGYGSWGEIERNSNSGAIDRESSGFFAGVDLPLGAGWSAGLAGGRSRADFEINARASTADVASWHAAAHVTGRFGGLRVAGGGAVSWHRIDTGRTIAFTGFSDSPTARYDGRTTQAFAEIAYSLPIGGATLEPFAEAAYVRVRTDGFTESGGAAALTGARETQSATFTTVGLRASAALGPLSLTGTAGWRHAHGLDPSASRLSFGAGSPFTVTAAPIAEDSIVAEAGVEVSLGGAARFRLVYSGQIAGRSEDHGARATLSLPF